MNIELTNAVNALKLEEFRQLLIEAQPIVASEAVMMDSMSRHMAGGFNPIDVNAVDQAANKFRDLNRRILEALK